MNENNLFNRIKRFFNSPFSQTGKSIFNISYTVIQRLILIGTLGLVLLGVCGLGIGLGYFANIISHTDIPSETSLKTSLGQLNQASSLYYQNGELISEVQSDLTRKIVSSEDISDYVKKGIIATEDSYFYEHNGIVPKAVLRATLQEVSGASSQTGGSTLTQQLVKQQLLTNELTFTRKAKEILLAMRVEKYFSKDEILTAYLNVSPFGRNSDGQNIAGIETAAEGIFGKSAKDLTLAQAAFLVGLPQSPYVYTPYTNAGTKKEDFSYGIQKMKIVLDAMKRQGYISEQDYQEAYNYDISQDFIERTNKQRPAQTYLYQRIHKEAIEILMQQQVEKEGRSWETISSSVDLYNEYYFRAADTLASSGYKIYSTIDKDIYNAMQTAISNSAVKLGPTYETPYTNPETNETTTVNEPPQLGSVAIENKTGKILGFIGGTDFNTSQIDHAFATRRSPGSTIKPLLVYAPAIENNLIYPATMLADTQISRLQQDGTYWTPLNASGSVSNQFISARQALKQSLNNPTIHLYGSMLARGIQTNTYMNAMGITAIPANEYANEAASVGGFSTGPTVLEQTSAFTTFANNGEYVPAYMIERIEDREGNVVYEHQSTKNRVFTEDTAYLMRSMLTDSINGGTTQYFKQYLNFSFPEAYGKTGTSDFYLDMWAIISTPQITIGQWAGWDNNHGVKHVFPIDNAYGNVSVRTQQVWADIANTMRAAKPEYFDTSQRFSPAPPSITQQAVLASTGTLEGNIAAPDGSQHPVSGEKVVDLFSKSRPPFPISYYFSPGASDKDLTDFWNKLINGDKEKEEKEKEEKEKKEKEEREKAEKEKHQDEESTDSSTSLENWRDFLSRYTFRSTSN
ncbi:penicillin-binding protein [Carnobacteriaceae bacterium zg-ZUI78]|nr:penicillin-binding protein [Carnobacteriaceae bacterium zg-ZUI78]